MLLNLLLANIINFLCFYFIFCVVFNSFIRTPVIIKNAKLKHALAIPIGTPVPVAIDAI